MTMDPSPATTLTSNDRSIGKTATIISSSKTPECYPPLSKKESNGRKELAKKGKEAAAEAAAEETMTFIYDNETEYDPNNFSESYNDKEGLSSVPCLDEEQGGKASALRGNNAKSEEIITSIYDNGMEYDPNDFVENYRDKDGYGCVQCLDKEQRKAAWRSKMGNSTLMSSDTTLNHFRKQSEEKDTEKYPPDSYSLMATHSPSEEPFIFILGFVVFIVQIVFLVFMVLSQTSPTLTNYEDTDNPTNSLFKLIPANVTILVRGTQAMAIVSYCLFADSSLKDCTTAVEIFPRFERANEGDKAWLMCLSCCLRFTQGDSWPSLQPYF